MHRLLTLDSTSTSTVLLPVVLSAPSTGSTCTGTLVLVQLELPVVVRSTDTVTLRGSNWQVLVLGP